MTLKLESECPLPQHLHCLHQGFLKYGSSDILGIYDTCKLSQPTEDLEKPIPGRDPEIRGNALAGSPRGECPAQRLTRLFSVA